MIEVITTEQLISGIIGFVMGAIVSWLITYGLIKDKLNGGEKN